MGMDETYGLLNWSWCRTRNSSFLQRLSSLQTPFQGPGVSEIEPHKIIFHPSTGLCVQRKSLIAPLSLGSCAESEAWSYTPEKKTIGLKGVYLCLQADGMGKAAKLGIFCTDATSKWEAISDSKMHLSSKLCNGSIVCLDIDSNNVIITNPCKCLSRDHMCDPGSQWFKIINSTRTIRSTSSRLSLPNSSGKDQFQLEISVGAKIHEEMEKQAVRQRKK
ncbi:hypothetical protein NE237_006534 [Protea cynaroides]|uniref:Uncharacterized protein n=1 Tax=Protea cynaroides TaxID=273540 RepID=A0A9Q0QV98_9MAGN|nr:hypothetical protein NE237_006534 [Protea cynaroides]